MDNKMEQKVKMKRGEEDEKRWKERLKKGMEVGEEDGGGVWRREMSVEEGEVSMEEGGRREEGGRERVQRKRRQQRKEGIGIWAPRRHKSLGEKKISS